MRMQLLQLHNCKHPHVYCRLSVASAMSATSGKAAAAFGQRLLRVAEEEFAAKRLARSRPQTAAATADNNDDDDFASHQNTAAVLDQFGDAAVASPAAPTAASERQANLDAFKRNLRNNSNSDANGERVVEKVQGKMVAALYMLCAHRH